MLAVQAEIVVFLQALLPFVLQSQKHSADPLSFLSANIVIFRVSVRQCSICWLSVGRNCGLTTTLLPFVLLSQKHSAEPLSFLSTNVVDFKASLLSFCSRLFNIHGYSYIDMAYMYMEHQHVKYSKK